MKKYSVVDGVVLVEWGSKSMLFHCDPEQFAEGVKRWHSGAMIQDALPFLSADEREFLMTGILPDEWDSMFGE